MIDPRCKIIFKSPDLNMGDVQKLAGSASWIKTEASIPPGCDVHLINELVVDTDTKSNWQMTYLVVEGTARFGWSWTQQDSLYNGLRRWLSKVGMTDHIATWLIVKERPSNGHLRHYMESLLALPADHFLVRGWETGVFKDLSITAPITGRVPMDTHDAAKFIAKF